MGEFQDMLGAAIAKWQQSGQNIRSLAKKLDCPHSTLVLAAAGKIKPPMKYLESWAQLIEPNERELFIRLGAATKLGPVADRALSSGTTYDSADLERQLAMAHARIAQLESELAELRARVAGSGDTALRELREMLDPDEANPPPSNNPRSSPVAGGSRRER